MCRPYAGFLGPKFSKNMFFYEWQKTAIIDYLN